MISSVVELSFSPPAVHALLQTSTFQASNRMTGVAMSFLHKTDVKNHLSRRTRKNILPLKPIAGPDSVDSKDEEQIRSAIRTSGAVLSPDGNAVAVLEVRQLSV